MVATVAATGAPDSPPGPTDAEDEAQRRRALRRMKALATGLLGLAAVVFLIARQFPDNTAAGYVEAFAEAAMVGALADWFAVTALFKHPLGIPVPHTALVPKRKDSFALSLEEFVEAHFLTGEAIRERYAPVHDYSGRN